MLALNPFEVVWRVAFEMRYHQESVHSAWIAHLSRSFSANSSHDTSPTRAASWSEGLLDLIASYTVVGLLLGMFI